MTDSTALVSDSEDETSLLVRSRIGKNETYNESDAGDTPVQRPTKRVVRVIESDEDMSDQDDVSNFKNSNIYSEFCFKCHQKFRKYWSILILNLEVRNGWLF